MLFLFKKSILVDQHFGEGVGGQEKCPMDTLHDKIDLGVFPKCYNCP